MQTLTELDNSLKWYFELHPEELDMAEAYDHMDLGDYLRQVLLWYYHFEKYLILKNQLVFIDKTVYTSPDIAVVKVALSREERKKLRSWRVNPPDRPAPAVAFEISSESNYPKDIDADKLRKDYADIGVKEYFAYDPDNYWGENVRLKGWRNNKGQMQALPLVDGRKIWSNELNCYVAASNDWMWFETREGELLPTRAEAKDQARQREYERAEAERERAERERLAKEVARERAEQAWKQAEQAQERAEQERLVKEAEMLKAGQERERAEVERERAEQERLAKEAARKRAETFAAKLRELEIDPDTL
jgi:Uma2 family endonuclease